MTITYDFTYDYRSSVVFPPASTKWKIWKQSGRCRQKAWFTEIKKICGVMCKCKLKHTCDIQDVAKSWMHEYKLIGIDRSSLAAD